MRPRNASTVGLDLVIGARQRTNPTLVRRHRVEGRSRRLSQGQSQFCLRGEPLQRLLGLLSPLRVDGTWIATDTRQLALQVASKRGDVAGDRRTGFCGRRCG
jgi:hypothetical protein